MGVYLAPPPEIVSIPATVNHLKIQRLTITWKNESSKTKSSGKQSSNSKSHGNSNPSSPISKGKGGLNPSNPISKGSSSTIESIGNSKFSQRYYPILNQLILADHVFRGDPLLGGGGEAWGIMTGKQPTVKGDPQVFWLAAGAKLRAHVTCVQTSESFHHPYVHARLTFWFNTVGANPLLFSRRTHTQRSPSLSECFVFHDGKEVPSKECPMER